MKRNPLTIPIAIVVGAIIIGGALYFSRKPSSPADPTGAGLPRIDNIVVRPIDQSDHILGNPNAPIQIIEYSDTECPYCKDFQLVMHQIIEEYGKTGQVVWVYRHFPLYRGTDALHPLAEKEAEATECVNELGGPTKFWQYLDKIYEITPSDNGLDPAQLPIIAQSMGIDRTAFGTCLNSGKYTNKISTSYDEALAAGANGTPYSVIVTSDGKKIPVPGTQTHDAMKAVITTLMGAMGTSTSQ